jgi:predicted nucleotidyltransferase
MKMTEPLLTAKHKFIQKLYGIREELKKTSDLDIILEDLETTYLIFDDLYYFLLNESTIAPAPLEPTPGGTIHNFRLRRLADEIFKIKPSSGLAEVDLAIEAIDKLEGLLDGLGFTKELAEFAGQHSQ